MRTDNTLYLIGQIKGLMSQFIISELEKQGIEGIVPSHGSIIVSLLHNESLTMRELAKKIGKDPSTVTTLVKKLNHFGYIDLTRDSVDKRVTRVSLTNEGKKLEEVLTKISEKIYDRQYQNISDKEKEIFREVLKKMIENFS